MKEHKLAVQYKDTEDRDVAARLVTAKPALVVKSRTSTVARTAT